MGIPGCRSWVLIVAILDYQIKLFSECSGYSKEPWILIQSRLAALLIANSSLMIS